MKDLSSLARNALAVSSMSGGNTVSSNENAFSGPGSLPVDPMPQDKDTADPAIGPMQDVLHGSPPARTGVSAGYAPSPVTWKETG